MTQDTSSTPPQSTSTKDAAREQVGEVGQRAKGEAGEVAGHAKQEAGQVVEEARAQARNVYEDARSQLRQQASTSNERAAGGVQQLASSLQALASGDAEQAGPLGDYAAQLGQRLDEVGQRMQDLGYEGVLEEVKGYARRSPGTFLLGAAAAGLVAGRLVRGERDRQQPSSSDSGHRATSAGAAGRDEAGVLQPAPGGGVMAPPTTSTPTRPLGTVPEPGGPDDVEHVHDQAVSGPRQGLS